MARPGRLIACPSCSCHVQASESRCPHCDSPIRQADGSVARTAAAVLLGLAAASCGGPETAIAIYGAPATGGAGGGATTTTSTGGMGGMTSTGGTAGSAGSTTTSHGGTGGGGTGGMTGGGGTGGETGQPIYGAPPQTGGTGGTGGN